MNELVLNNQLTKKSGQRWSKFASCKGNILDAHFADSTKAILRDLFFLFELNCVSGVDVFKCWGKSSYLWL